jgi:NDP-sugar pyrophosphorylase family protein
MVVYRNENRFDRSNVVVADGLVKAYDKERTLPGMDYINFGVSLLRKEALSLVPSGIPYSQEEWYAQLIERGELLAYEVRERFYEIGSPRGLEEFRRLVAAGVLP